MTSTQFFSVTKFITKLNEQENIIKKDYNIVDPIIYVFFEGNDAFKNKYGICFKQIFITDRTESKPKSIRYDRIQEIYGCQPIISCKENDNKSLPNGKDKKDMFVLDIHLNQKVELVIDDSEVGCGCTASAKFIKVAKILITKDGKTEDMKYAYNDIYSQLIKYGISLKLVV